MLVVVVATFAEAPVDSSLVDREPRVWVNDGCGACGHDLCVRRVSTTELEGLRVASNSCCLRPSEGALPASALAAELPWKPLIVGAHDCEHALDRVDSGIPAPDLLDACGDPGEEPVAGLCLGCLGRVLPCLAQGPHLQLLSGRECAMLPMEPQVAQGFLPRHGQGTMLVTFGEAFGRGLVGPTRRQSGPRWRHL